MRQGMIWLISGALLILTGCQDQPAGPAVLQGYAEADLVHVGAIEAGRLVAVPVDRGQPVPVGAVLFRQDDQREQLAVAEAQARLAQAQAQWQDVRLGARREELAVITAQIREATAQLDFAEAEHRRYSALAARDVAAARQEQQARSQRDALRAKISELQAYYAAQQLPGRDAAIAAAEAAMAAQREALDQAMWRLDQRQGVAPVAGRVETVLRRVGEVAGAGAPVISLLPDGAVKLRAFVPEPMLSQIRLGQIVGVGCDGCVAGLQAKISYIAAEAQFTPPVIFSQGRREKLVFLIEARPLPGAHFNPGQPVDITLAGVVP